MQWQLEIRARCECIERSSDKTKVRLSLIPELDAGRLLAGAARLRPMAADGSIDCGARKNFLAASRGGRREGGPHRFMTGLLAPLPALARILAASATGYGSHASRQPDLFLLRIAGL
jgi:hypothetical protein